MKPYLKDYVGSNFRMYNGKNGNVKVHVIQFIDDLGTHEFDDELRLREFFKSHTDDAYSWYANLARILSKHRRI